MPRLPDVQSLGARPTPGAPRALSLEPPASAIDTASQGEAAFDVGQQLTQVAQRMFARRDAINHAKALNEIESEGRAELLRLSTEADLSDDATLQQYQGWLSQKEADLIQRYGGAGDMRAALTRDLERTRGRFLGQAAEMSTQIAIDNLDRQMTTRLGGLQTYAMNDPSNTMDALNQWTNTVRTYASALPPGAEQAALAGGYDEIAKAALTASLMRGDLDGVTEMLSGGLSEYVSPGTMQDIQSTIAQQRASQNEIANNIAAKERQLGRSLTEQELLMELKLMPATPQVVVNNGPGGGMPPPIAGTPPPGWQYVLDPASNSYVATRITGGPAEEEAAQAAGRRVTREAAANQRADLMTRDINRVFDIIEANPNIATGPLAGRAGSLIPGSPADQINILLDPIRANVGFAELQAMRDASPTGGALGQVTERELSLLQSLLGNLDTRLSEEQLSENLAGVASVFARVAYGSDDELDLAVQQGNLTEGQALAAAQARDEMVAQAQTRAQSVIARKTSEQRPGSPARVQADPANFERTLAAIQRNPDALSPDEIAAQGFTPQQLEILADAYDNAIAATPPEISAFVQSTPDAAQYAEAMADLLESGQAATLEEAYRMAKGSAGGQ